MSVMSKENTMEYFLKRVRDIWKSHADIETSLLKEKNVDGF